MGTELVAGRHRDDIDLFEQAVRGKLASTPTPACSLEVAEAGLQLAGRCIEQALAQVRAQALSKAEADEQEPTMTARPTKTKLH